MHSCYGIQRIVSGGQTGADRAALDWAKNHHIPHGGWLPPGRLAEDGVIDSSYQMSEMASGSYRQRTKKNVEDSDGTLILNLGLFDGGSLATKRFAERMGRPHLVLQLDKLTREESKKCLIAWLEQFPVQILNVAGPRESKRPGIYSATLVLLDGLC